MVAKKYKTQLNITQKDLVTNLLDTEEDLYYNEPLKALLKVRMKEFCKLLTEKLEGKEVKAFGPKGQGLWGGSDTVKPFAIKSIQFEYVDTFENHDRTLKERRENPELYSCVRVSLDKYRSDSCGLIYTDETFEKNIQKEIKKLGFNGEIDYTEQGMQGTTYVSMSLIMPVDVIAPDAHDFIVKHNADLYKAQQKDKRAVAKKARP